MTNYKVTCFGGCFCCYYGLCLLMGWAIVPTLDVLNQHVFIHVRENNLTKTKQPMAHLPTLYLCCRGAGLRFGATGASTKPT